MHDACVLACRTAVGTLLQILLLWWKFQARFGGLFFGGDARCGVPGLHSLAPGRRTTHCTLSAEPATEIRAADVQQTGKRILGRAKNESRATAFKPVLRPDFRMTHDAYGSEKDQRTTRNT